MACRRTRAVLLHKNVNTVDQFEYLKPYLELCSRVCVDYTGPGVGFGDMCEKEFGRWDPAGHAFGKCELCTFSAPFKCDIFPKLKTAFDGMRLRVPVDVEVREDLHEMQQVVRDNKYTYTAKRTSEGHSDRCTALALAVRAASFGGEYVAPVVAAKRRDYDRRTI